MRLHVALRLPNPDLLETPEGLPEAMAALLAQDRAGWVTRASESAARAMLCGVRVPTLSEWFEQSPLEQEALVIASGGGAKAAPEPDLVEGITGTTEALDEAARDLRTVLDGFADQLAAAGGAPP